MTTNNTEKTTTKNVETNNKKTQLDSLFIASTRVYIMFYSTVVRVKTCSSYI